MSLADRPQALGEIRRGAVLFGERPKIREQARRLVVAGRISARDLSLDLAPDAFAPSRDRIEPRPAGLLGRSYLPFPFGGGLLGRGALAGEADLAGARTEL